MKTRLLLLGIVLTVVFAQTFAQSEFWGTFPGMTMESKGAESGGFFKTDSTGKNLIKEFEFGNSGGLQPQYAKLCEAGNGKLYGLTSSGGQFNYGSIFEYDPVTEIYIDKFNFNYSDGSGPNGSLVLASDGTLYGMTYSGGSQGSGVLFQYDPTNNVYTKKFDFGSAYGANPYGSLTLANNGKLYGMTTYGGALYYGVLFEFDIQTGVYTKKLDFTDANGANPYGELTQMANGKMYGLTSAGGLGYGTLFEYNAGDDSVTTRIVFDYSSNGGYPYGSLLATSTDKLYGMTSNAGSNGVGILFEYTPIDSSLVVKYNFNYAIEGGYPYGSLMEDDQGRIYGMTSSDNINYAGKLFEFLPGLDTCVVKADFIGNTGINPYGTLMQTTSNKIFGLTGYGGSSGGGTLFEYDTATYEIKTKVNLGESLGRVPESDLIKGINGKLYGTATQGGKSNDGVVFEYDPGLRKYNKLADFDFATTGSYPKGAIIEAESGVFYGTTVNGGIGGGGTIYKFDLGLQTISTIYNFVDSLGSSPKGGLIQWGDTLFGMTSSGGSNFEGVIFSYNLKDSAYNVRHHFYSFSDGAYPEGRFLLASNDTLYGMTSSGGAGGNGGGTLFEFHPSSNYFAVKKEFNLVGGMYPYGSLIEPTPGILFGLTSSDLPNYNGTLFSYNISTGDTTINVNFDYTNGSYPHGDLVKAANGKLYGTTQNGGDFGYGVVFEYDMALDTLIVTSSLSYDLGNSSSSLIEVGCSATNYNAYAAICMGESYLFNGKTLTQEGTYIETFTSVTGCDSIVTLFLSENCPSKTEYWGTTVMGGATDEGVIFKVDEKGENYSLEHSFSMADGGINPYGSLNQATNGKLYGTTGFGGTNNTGVLFEYNPATKTYAQKVDFIGANGAIPSGDFVELPNRKFYGMTEEGGVNNAGVLFEYDPDSNLFVKKIDFDSVSTGARPSGTLLLAANGLLYGLTYSGGLYGDGVLFEYNPVTNICTPKFSFNDSISGSNPSGSLMQANNGRLYGSSSRGGTYGFGVLFEYEIVTNTFFKKIDFDGTNTGSYPQGKLLLAQNGLLYGLTKEGGQNNYGVVFNYDFYSDYFSVSVEFDSINNGKNPNGSLIQSSTGNLLGMTTNGGLNDKGVLFEFDNVNLITKHLFDGTNGANPYYGSLLMVDTYPLPKSIFTYSVMGLEVTFNNLSTEANIFNWKFGDGTVSQLKTPVHTYNKAGKYEVCLISEDSLSQLNAKSCTYIIVGDTSFICDANFEYTVNGNEVSFTNTSTGPYTDVYWDYGDGNFSTTDDISHIYGKSGYYEVSLTIFNSVTNCLGFVTKTVKASTNDSLLCDARFSYFAYGDSIAFKNESLGNVNSYFWDFGDGNYSFGKNAEHVYTESGYYEVNLTISDSVSGCQDEIFKVVYVYSETKASCSALFSYYPKQNKVSFVSDAIGDYSQHFWDFNDGTNSNMVNPVHTFLKPGYYDVAYTVIDTFNGCFNTQNKLVFVEGLGGAGSAANEIKAKYSYMPSEKTYEVNFMDESQGNVSNWYWDFGDNTPAGIEKNPAYTYSINDYYRVCLTASNAEDQKTKCKFIAVGDVTKSSTSFFTYFADSMTATGHFKSKSLGDITKYYWDFGDGNVSVQRDPSHTYADTGYYGVCLTTTSASDVQKTYCKDIRIGNSIDNPCLFSCVWPGDANNDLEANHYDIMTIGLNYGLEGPKRDSSSIDWYGQFAQNWSTYQLDGTNNKYGDANGDGTINFDDVEAIQQNFAFSHYKQPDVKAAAWQVSCIWDTVGSKIAGSRSKATAQLSPPAKGKAGAIYAIGYEIEVIGGEKIKWDSVTVNFDKSWIGEDGLSMLTVTHMDTTEYIIYIGMTRIDQQDALGSGEIASISFKFKDDVDEKGVSFIVTSKGGIESTGDPTSVDGTIELVLKSPLEVCAGETAIIDAGSGFDTYTWSNNVTDTSRIEVSEAGYYAVTVTNSSGASAIDSVQVIVNEAPIVNLGADITQNGSVELDAGSGFATYLWSTSSEEPTITVTESGEYSVWVSNEFGCYGSDTINITITDLNDELSNQISVYPNPNNGKFWLIYKNTIPESHVVQVFNLEGKMVWHNEFNETKGQKNRIELENIEKGIYFLKLINQDKVDLVRFVVL